MKKLYSIFLGIILFCSFSHAEIFYVSTMGNDSNDGKSWETAYANVQTAIDAAAKVATSSSPAQVWVAKGTYAHGSEMLMKSYIEVYGGFIGNEKSLYERVPSNKTILSGDLQDIKKKYRKKNINAAANQKALFPFIAHANRAGNSIYIYTLHNRQVLDIKKKLDFDKKFVRI